MVFTPLAPYETLIENNMLQGYCVLVGLNGLNLIQISGVDLLLPGISPKSNNNDGVAKFLEKEFDMH